MKKYKYENENTMKKEKKWRENRSGVWKKAISPSMSEKCQSAEEKWRNEEEM
jgi:hypothetical protein